MELYEEDWEHYQRTKQLTSSFDLLWDNYTQQLQNDVMDPVSSYINQFSETKQKIQKRGRKLVDYDSARHSYQSAANAKKIDEQKLARTKENLDEAQKTYEDLNNELLTNLPNMHNERINFYSKNFQTVFTNDFVLHNELAKLNESIVDVVDRLNQSVLSRQSYVNSLHQSRSSEHSDTDKEVGEKPKVVPLPRNFVNDENSKAESLRTSSTSSTTEDKPVASTPPRESVISKNDEENEQNNRLSKPSSVNGENPESPVTDEPREQDHNENVDSKPRTSSDTSTEEPAWRKQVLYRVITTHTYAGEDDDELSFEAQEIINVVPYADPEEQDAGWLTGIKESDWNSKGVFPENFTKRQ